MSARARLREETREAHERLDAHFSQYDLSQREDYAAFLTAHATAFVPIEQALTDAGAALLFPDWPEMIRSRRLVEDLKALGIALPNLIEPPTFNNAAAICGGAYVLEGSRLGGSILRKAVDSDLPLAYLSHDPALRWPLFVAEIERILKEDVDRSHAVASANAVFECFLRAAGKPKSGAHD